MTTEENLQILTQLQNIQKAQFGKRTMNISVGYGYIVFTYFYIEHKVSKNDAIYIYVRDSLKSAQDKVTRLIDVLNMTKPDLSKDL